MTTVPAGLCENCLYARIIRSDRGSIFYQCRKSFYDPRFPKYPSLPVRYCIGYERRQEAPPDLKS